MQRITLDIEEMTKSEKVPFSMDSLIKLVKKFKSCKGPTTTDLYNPLIRGDVLAAITKNESDNQLR